MLRINHIIKLAVSGALLLIFSGVLGQEQEDRLLQVLKQELEYNLQELKKQDSAPYYMNLRVMDDYSVSVTSSFGAVANTSENRDRKSVV